MWYLYCCFLIFRDIVTIVFSYPFVYIHKVVTLFFLGKKSPYIYIYIFIYIFTHFWGVTTPSPPKKHIINKSHGFAHFSRKLLALPMVRPWPSNPCRAGVGTWQTAKTHQSQLLKASLVHRSTRCSFFFKWCIYLHYGEKIGYFQGEMQAKNIIQGCPISATRCGH